MKLMQQLLNHRSFTKFDSYRAAAASLDHKKKQCVLLILVHFKTDALKFITSGLKERSSNVDTFSA